MSSTAHTGVHGSDVVEASVAGGKLKMAAWLAAHPGYTREQCRVWRERHRTVKFTRCHTVLCEGVFVRPRRSARMFCDD